MSNTEEMSRKLFLQKTGQTVLLLTASGSVLSVAHCGPALPRTIRFANLDESMAAVRDIAIKTVDTHSQWNLSQILQHLSQSIEYSFIGYPELKPSIIRKTVGRVVLGKFLGQGYMTHNVQDAIPGAPPLDPKLAIADAVRRFEKAVSDFRSYQDTLQLHFVYDAVTKAEYEKVHAMHCANHMSAISVQA